MYVKRPLCYVAVIISFLIFLFVSIFPIQPSFDVDSFDGKTLTVTGRVSFKDSKNGKIRVYLNDIEKISNNDIEKVSGLICELDDETYNFDDIRIGQRVMLSGEYEPYEIPANEGQFDMRSYYLIRGYEGKIKKGIIEKRSAEYSIINENLFKIKIISENIFGKYMSENDSGVMNALILGDKTELDEEIKDIYKNAGISHILSLSGLHIASVGLSLLKILKKSGIPIFISNLIASIVMVMYAIMTGMSTSTKRALIMFVLSIIADVIGKSYDILSAASFAYMCSLISNPYYIQDSGFLLSFGAIIGISILYPAMKTVFLSQIREYVPQNLKGKAIIVSKGIVDSILVTLSVTLMTLPITAASYYKISRYSFACNIVVIPLLGILLFLGFASIGIGMFSKLMRLLCKSSGLLFCVSLENFCDVICKIMLRIASVILTFYERIASFFAQLPNNMFVIGKPSAGRIIIYCFYLIFVFFVAENIKKITYIQQIIDRNSLHNSIHEMKKYGKNNYKITLLFEKLLKDNKNDDEVRYIKGCEEDSDRTKKKNIAIIRIVIVAMTIFSLWNLTKRNVDNLEIRNISIGQGDSTLIFGRNTPVILVDGGSSSVKNAGKYRLQPVLLSNGISRVNYAFLSHLDSDHINAVIELLKDSDSGVKIEKVVITDFVLRQNDEETIKKVNELKTAVIESEASIYSIKYGDEIDCGDISIKCIWPTGDVNMDSNSGSMVLLANHKKSEFKALFTGDIDFSAEELIEIGDIDYLKVAHHGSNGSSSDVFLQKALPNISLISCGLNNSYNHPGQDTLERLNKIKGNHIFRTDLQGEIITKVDNKGHVRVRSFLND